MEAIKKLDGVDLKTLAKSQKNDPLRPLKHCKKINPLKGNQLIPQPLMDRAENHGRNH
jgi:hypothetical protein